MDITNRSVGFPTPAPTGLVDSRGPVTQQTVILREYPTPDWVGGTPSPARAPSMTATIPMITSASRDTRKIG